MKFDINKTTSTFLDFTQKKAIFKRSTKQQDEKPNFLDFQEQEELINNIFMNCYNVKIDGQKEILLNIGNGFVQHLERNYKNFSTNIKMKYRNITDKDGFESINLPKIFEVLKTLDCYEFCESRSIFNKSNKLIIDEESKTLINEKILDYDFEVEKINEDVYNEIIEDVKKHWLGHIDTIINHIVAGKYVSDKKNIWLLILANSNFGKSKLLKWIEPFGGTAFVKFEDLIGGGISDKSPSEFEGKLCLAIDEVMSFHRKLFEIEDNLMIRPMRNHAVRVKIGSRILLSADGGTFNNDYSDKQIQNRVAVIDLRQKSKENLEDIKSLEKFGKYTINRVMTHYLYNCIIQKIAFYESHTLSKRANIADNVITSIFDKYKQNKKDFFEKVEESLYYILEDFQKALDEYHYQLLKNAFVKTKKGYIIKRASEVLFKVLINFDKDLEYELKFKTISQIADRIDGFKLGSHRNDDGKTIRGLLIPIQKKIPVEIYDKNKNLAATAALDKDGNLLDKNGKELFWTLHKQNRFK